MDLSTLYRNLELFVEAGIAEREIIDRVSHYRLKCSEDHHHHLICTGCNKVVHLDYCPIDDLSEIAKEHHYLLQEHRLEIFGLCEECQKKGFR